VVVAAPAGYGKTTLLRQWSERDPRPFAWVSLEESDDDPVSFLSYVAAAIDSVDSLPASLFDALRAPQAVRAIAMPRLASAFAEVEMPMVMVLEDVHRVSGRESLDAVEWLCDCVPERSSFVLSSRSEPSVGLGRMRSKRQLLELGAADLRLDQRETRALLEAADVHLADEDVTRLCERSEGWAAGLSLTALAMRSGKPLADVHELRGNDPFVDDYFRDELLFSLAPPDVQFLTGTSILDQLSGPICDAVLERSDSSQVLDRLRRSIQFIVPLDRRGYSYRYHHLFQDLLKRELSHEGDDRVRTLNRRAADWSIESGDGEKAIRYATAARDYELLDRLIQRLAVPVYNSGRLATVDEWIRPFEDDRLLEKHAPVAMIGGFIHALSGRPEEAMRWLRAAERGAAAYDGDLADGSASATSWVAVLRAALCPAGPDAMKSDAEEALEDLAGGSFWRRVAHTKLGVAAHLADDLDLAEREWDVALTMARESGADPLTAQVLGHRALLALDQGDVSRAREMVTAAETLPGPQFGTYATHSLVLAAGARLALVDNEPDRARRELVRAQTLRPLVTWAFPWAAVQVRLELARVAVALMDEVSCRTLLSEIKAIQAHRPALGKLVDDIARIEEQVGGFQTARWNWAASLTAAELRVVPLLATHLTFEEIGERLFVTRATVASHAHSIYRKLGASTRSEAVERAVELGLLDESVLVRRLKIAQND
jgi:LuxR family maltose regulon positive regulatory protein